MLTVIRYVVSSEALVPFAGAPLSRALRIFYDLPQAAVRTRIEEALRDGQPGVAVSDLTGLSTGTVGEEVLERLFPTKALERAFVGTEAIPSRGAV